MHVYVYDYASLSMDKEHIRPESGSFIYFADPGQALGQIMFPACDPWGRRDPKNT